MKDLHSQVSTEIYTKVLLLNVSSLCGYYGCTSRFLRRNEKLSN